MSECNETDVDRCLQKAMLACGDRGKHFTAMTDGETYEWENGQVFLRVLPEKSCGCLHKTRPSTRQRLSTSRHVVSIQHPSTSLRGRLLILTLAIDPEQEQVLTYGIFTDVLQGINNFRLFYTHLSFWYDIYVYPGEEGYKTYVGEGQLNE